jgi:hypothetical protein
LIAGIPLFFKTLFHRIGLFQTVWFLGVSLR